MGSEKYERSVTMVCPTCGNKDFEHGDDGGPLRCRSCDRIFTRDELIKENGAIIDAEVNEIKEEVLNDLKKVFASSKFIKFK